MKKPNSSQNDLRINDEIRVPKVRLVDNSGEMLGVLSIQDALNKASDAGLDLVEVSPQADPPVCKLLDYGKYRFEAQKKQKEARKKQKVIQIKEVKLRVNIADHDYQVKLRSAHRFLEDEKNKVKISLRFRGREIVHNDLAKALLNRFAEDLKECGKVEMDARMEGRQMIMVLAPL